jgi:endonuclease/exonuclease/phosphatase family metal-dependent hydrolase
MHKIVLSLLFLLFAHRSLLPAQELADKAPDRLTIASWNVEWFFDDQKSNNASDIAREQSPPSREIWDWKLNSVAGSIATLAPTIIALQEVESRETVLALTRMLLDKHKIYYRVAFIDGFDMGTEQDVAVLYQSGLVEYSRREQNKAMFDSQEYYNLSKHLICRFEWQTETDHVESLTLMTAHFRAGEEASEPRRKQAHLAHRWLADAIEANENVILLGDFNLESRFGTAMENDDGIKFLTGKHTKSLADDLLDLHEHLEPVNRKTHLVLDKQFDRILVSKCVQDDASQHRDLVFKSIEVRREASIVGKGIDEDHFENRYTKPINERDISDHFPIIAEFEFK